MAIRNLSQDVIVVKLPPDGSKRTEELKRVNEIVSKKRNCHVIVDFSKVEIINSWNVSNLLILRSLLQESGHQLVLCSVAPVTKCIFVVAGLSEVLVFADDRAAALAMIQGPKSPAHAGS